MPKHPNLEAITSFLNTVGFKKRAGDVFTLDLMPGVLGWLGLNRATQHRAPGEVEINPVVGVRFQEVERVVAECRGEKFHNYQPPTISTPLGYLMPEAKYKAWVIVPGHSAEGIATDMGNAITTYGVKFMRSVVDLVELQKRLEERSGFEHQLIYRRPVAAFIAGEPGKARALLDVGLVAIGTRTDLAAAEFRKFAESLRRRLPPELR
ncbi:MAG: hypothetical protein M3020_00585 [Myxococcota bacterium]|jgi:hypothetical protein|nr:hypothetical protein [Myxococcota bacterium]